MYIILLGLAVYVLVKWFLFHRYKRKLLADTALDASFLEAIHLEGDRHAE